MGLWHFSEALSGCRRVGQSALRVAEEGCRGESQTRERKSKGAKELQTLRYLIIVPVLIIVPARVPERPQEGT